MRCETTISLLVGIAVLGTMTTTAGAALPDDRISEYSLRETPTDPNSDVLFVVALELTAVDQDGNDVAWYITKITVTNENDASWVDSSPAPDTPNGYWRVTHSDPADPQVKEFDWPPSLVGTATAQDPADDDLHYDFRGDYCDTECSQLYNGRVGGATYRLMFPGSQTPVAEGDDEPVEIEGGTVYGS